jgi:methanol metabolism-related c-type cytochrome
VTACDASPNAEPFRIDSIRLILGSVMMRGREKRHRSGRTHARRLVALVLVVTGGTAPPGAAQPVAPSEEGAPTYNIAPDGTVDWSTYSGFRRYNAECHHCHGPDGEGSTYAPALLQPMRTMSYAQFRDIIILGSRTLNTAIQQVMRPMGGDPNVMCYLDDIYVYLKARADGAVGRGRPQKYAPKPEAATRHEAACTGQR